MRACTHVLKRIHTITCTLCEQSSMTIVILYLCYSLLMVSNFIPPNLLLKILKIFFTLLVYFVVTNNLQISIMNLF